MVFAELLNAFAPICVRPLLCPVQTKWVALARNSARSNRGITCALFFRELSPADTSCLPPPAALAEGASRLVDLGLASALTPSDNPLDRLWDGLIPDELVLITLLADDALNSLRMLRLPCSPSHSFFYYVDF